jgi:hypothetical protein
MIADISLLLVLVVMMRLRAPIVRIFDQLLLHFIRSSRIVEENDSCF